MTTRIMVVNFGPQPVEVTNGTPPSIVYPQQSIAVYVFGETVAHMREVKPAEPVDIATPAGPSAPPTTDSSTS